MTLQETLNRVAEQTDFSGVALVEHQDDHVAEVVRGMASRTHGVANTVETQFATASATKAFTALTIASLVESGKLELTTPIAEITGPALTVDPAVTIEHLLGHTSGVGDYLDEELLGDVDDHVLGGMSAHTLERPHHYLPLLNQYPQVFPPGMQFTYNNSGYIMLSLAAERVGGRSFHQLVAERVFEAASMTDTGFFRSDDLPPRAATGYLKNGRSNVFHLPVIGGGDGGAYTTVADFSKFWRALFAGDIVSTAMVDKMTAVRQILPGGEREYGLGFWLAAGGKIVMLEGMDAGVSFQSAVHRDSGTICTALSNTSSGVWPLFAELLPYLRERAGA